MMKHIVLAIPVILMSANTHACDDKACESAYLSATSQYIANHVRQANTAKIEREAHALNRERRDYALQNHIHRIQLFLTR